MSQCPDIDELLALPAASGETVAHVEGCGACGALVALATFRVTGARASERPEACAAFEPAMAALVDGKLGAERLADLVEHLGCCGACNDLAARLTLFRGELDDVPEPEIPAWGEDARRRDEVTIVEATETTRAMNEVTDVKRRPREVTRPDDGWRWRRAAPWAAAIAAGVAIGLIGAQALFLRDRGAVAAAPSTTEQAPSAARTSPGGALDLEGRLAELEARMRAAEERAREAERRASSAEERLREIDARPAPSTPTAPSAPTSPSTAPARPADPLAPVPADWAAPDRAAYLTIVCNPYCDELIDNGNNLGPSPIVHKDVAPGRHRITLKRGDVTKSLSLEMRPGDTIAQRIDMR